MDKASRMARAKEMGFSHKKFWRGEPSGVLTKEYPAGAHFSRSKDYADDVAKKAGLSASRQFRLKLNRAFKSSDEFSVSDVEKIIRAANLDDAKYLTGLFGISLKQFAKEAKRNPNRVITDGAALLPLLRNTTDGVGILKRAGYNAVDTGRDVIKLDGSGIRLFDAKFDIEKKHLRDITAGIGGGVALSSAISNQD